jgi:hypothetical protein
MLNGDEIGTNEWDVIKLTEGFHDAAVVNAWYHDRQKIGEKGRLLLQIESESLVVAAQKSAGVNERSGRLTFQRSPRGQ